jgi:hypothetical protein
MTRLQSRLITEYEPEDYPTPIECDDIIYYGTFEDLVALENAIEDLKDGERN